MINVFHVWWGGDVGAVMVVLVAGGNVGVFKGKSFHFHLH